MTSEAPPARTPGTGRSAHPEHSVHPEHSAAPQRAADLAGSRIPVRGLVVAIDGPSGSGKSSVSRAVARRLGLAYLDTGAMYRAVAWWCADSGIDLADTAAVSGAVTRLRLEVGTDPDRPTVAVEGTEVTEAIRLPEVSTVVSKVATNLGVRAELVRRQQEIVALELTGGAASRSGGRGVVVEGRDITTVVVPEAPVRLLLTASEDARLARRARELHGTADEAAIEATRDQVVRRDADDSTVVQFTIAADGVVTVDSSELDLDQTVEAVLAVVRQSLAALEDGAAGLVAPTD